MEHSRQNQFSWVIDRMSQQMPNLHLFLNIDPPIPAVFPMSVNSHYNQARN